MKVKYCPNCLEKNILNEMIRDFEEKKDRISIFYYLCDECGYKEDE